MTALLAAAEADPMTWIDLIAMALTFAFILGILWLMSRWFG